MVGEYIKIDTTAGKGEQAFSCHFLDRGAYSE
jgi:hypothetical protein